MANTDFFQIIWEICISKEIWTYCVVLENRMQICVFTPSILNLPHNVLRLTTGEKSVVRTRAVFIFLLFIIIINYSNTMCNTCVQQNVSYSITVMSAWVKQTTFPKILCQPSCLLATRQSTPMQFSIARLLITCNYLPLQNTLFKHTCLVINLSPTLLPTAWPSEVWLSVTAWSFWFVCI